LYGDSSASFTRYAFVSFAALAHGLPALKNAQPRPNSNEINKYEKIQNYEWRNEEEQCFRSWPAK